MNLSFIISLILTAITLINLLSLLIILNTDKKITEMIELINLQKNEEKKDTKIDSKGFKRKHQVITQASFENPITPRRNPYKIYENDNGLYEPRTPQKGIKIKEKKED